MRKELNGLLMVARIIGGDPRCQNWCTKLIKILSRVCAIVVNVCFILEIALNWQGIRSLAKLNLYPSLIIIQIKLITLQMRSKKLKHMFELIENLDTKHQPDELMRKMNKIHKLATVFIITFGVIGFITSIVFLVTPLFSSDKAFVFTAYAFCDINTSPCFEINYIWNVINQMLLLATVTSYDCLFIYFVAEVCCAIEILKGMLNDFKTGEFVVQHNAAINYVKELNKFYSKFLLMQSWFSLAGIILGLYMLTSEGIPPPLSLFAKYGVLIMTLLVQLFIYCCGGAIVMDQTETIANDVFFTVDWSSGTRSNLRKNLSFIILRAQRVEKLSVGKMMDLNLECYVTVLKNALSVYTLLLTMEKKATMTHEIEK